MYEKNKTYLVKSRGCRKEAKMFFGQTTETFNAHDLTRENKIKLFSLSDNYDANKSIFRQKVLIVIFRVR